MANDMIGAMFTKVKSGEDWTIVKIIPDGTRVTLAKKGDEDVTVTIAVSSLKDKRQWIKNENHKGLVPMPGIEKLEDLKNEYAHTEAVELSEAETEYVKNDVETTMEVLLATGKIKRVKVKREPKPVVGIGKDIRDYIVEKTGSMNGVVLTDSGRFTSLKINNKMFAAIFSYSKKSLTLGVRSIATKDSGYEPTSKANHMMDYRFKISTLDDGVKKMIDILLGASETYQLNKNNKSKEVH